MKSFLVVCALMATAEAAPVGAVAEIDRMVATVDGDVLWQSQVDERMASAAQSGVVLERAAVIDDLVDDLLIARGADELHIDVTNADLDAALDAIRKQNGIDDAALDKALESIHMSRAAYRVELARQLRALRWANAELRPKITVSDADVAKEAAAQGKKPPLADADKAMIRQTLEITQLERAKAAWLAARRKATRIVVLVK